MKYNSQLTNGKFLVDMKESREKFNKNLITRVLKNCNIMHVFEHASIKKIPILHCSGLDFSAEALLASLFIYLFFSSSGDITWILAVSCFSRNGLTPLPKESSKSSPENFRQISLARVLFFFLFTLHNSSGGSY